MIIALEGGICSGKSTLSKGLVDCGYFRIPEYMEFLDASQREALFKVPEPNRLSTFLQIERRRKTLAGNMQDVILDRSYLTLLAFEYARGRESVAQRKLRECVSDESLMQPDKTIFLDVTFAERQRRFTADCRTSCPSFFMEPEFNERLREFFVGLPASFKVDFLRTDRRTLAALKSDVISVGDTSSFSAL